jgi:hypothetical protein
MMLRRRASIGLALFGALAGALALSGCASLGYFAQRSCEGLSSTEYSACVHSEFDREQRDIDRMINWRSYGP